MSHPALRTTRLIPMAGLLLLAAALGLDYASRHLFGTTAAGVHVRWAPHVDAPHRQALELRFCLADSEPTEGLTYSYLLVDTSEANIRSLVTHPDVDDTHDLDRSAFRVADAAERFLLADDVQERRSRLVGSVARAMWIAAAGVAALALLLTLGPRRVDAVVRVIRSLAWWIVTTVHARIPAVSAEGAAAFRIVFGTATLMLFASWLGPVSGLSASEQPHLPWPVRAAGVLLSSPCVAEWLSLWLSVTGVLFVAGAATRLSFAAFTLGALTWGVLYSAQSGHHPVSALLVALICLLPSRWGDAWSLDAWLHPRRVCGDLREYGYTVWVPGVVLGIALAAAAASKLAQGGLGWILNGTVKYHFVTDAANAPIDWGVPFVLVPGMAVALSFATIAVEGLVVVCAAFGSPAVRLLTAAAVMALLVGFWLFQGVFWPAWWILLLSFAPWHLVRPARLDAHDAPRLVLRLGLVQAMLLFAVIGQQVVVSARRLEGPPIFSAYDMYSRTYDRPEDYPATGGYSHWLVATMTDRTEQACRVNDDDAARLAALEMSEYREAASALLAGCIRDTGAVRTATLEQMSPDIDWTAGRYRGTRRVRLRDPVAVAAREAR